MAIGSAKKQNRKQVRLGGRIDSRLKDYSLAAAGVGALALAAPVQASISSVSPNLNIPSNGTPTFLPVPGYPHAVTMYNSVSADSRSVSISSNATSAAKASFFGKSALTHLPPASVGQRVPTNVQGFGSFAGLAYSSTDGFNFNSFSGSNGYVGFSVTKGGSTHYGWVRVTITNGEGGYTATVNQIAIEQCAGQPITVGTSTGGANCSTPPPTTPVPNSLYLMSLGIAGLAGLEALRRLKQAA